MFGGVDGGRLGGSGLDVQGEMSRRQLMGTFKLSETSPLPFVFLEQMATGSDRGRRQHGGKVNDVSQVRQVLKPPPPRFVIGCLLRKLKSQPAMMA